METVTLIKKTSHCLWRKYVAYVLRLVICTCKWTFVVLQTYMLQFDSVQLFLYFVSICYIIIMLSHIIMTCEGWSYSPGGTTYLHLHAYMHIQQISVLDSWCQTIRIFAAVQCNFTLGKHAVTHVDKFSKLCKSDTIFCLVLCNLHM